MSDWQPIETAPKYGSRLVLASGSSHVFTGYWSFCDEDEPDENYWVDDSGVWWNPHHWMPLPEPPEKA